MSTAQSFTLHPLSRALKLLSITPFLLISEMGQARVLNPGEVLDINGTTAPDKYVLNAASTLNAKDAQTRDIAVNNSTLNLSGSTVQATSANGVHLNAGTANITRSNISSDRTGLIVSRDAAGNQVSTAIVSDSVITGVTSGVTVNGSSQLKLTGSTVTGTGRNAAGLRLFNGSATVIDSSITGSRNGIDIVPDTGLDATSTLVLNHSKVQGLDGSAIVVDTLGVGAAKASIAVLKGSTLSASNGILMDVRNGAEGNLRVGSSDLIGDIVVDGTSTANVLLEDSATLTGRLQNVQNLGVDPTGHALYGFGWAVKIFDRVFRGGVKAAGTAGTAGKAASAVKKTSGAAKKVPKGRVQGGEVKGGFWQTVNNDTTQFTPIKVGPTSEVLADVKPVRGAKFGDSLENSTTGLDRLKANLSEGVLQEGVVASHKSPVRNQPPVFQSLMDRVRGGGQSQRKEAHESVQGVTRKKR